MTITYEWTTEERPCRCTPEHRRFCARCNGTGVRKLARLRRVEIEKTDGEATTTKDATGED